MDKDAQIFWLIIVSVGLIVVIAIYFSAPSNKNCYNCDIELRGDYKGYMFTDKDGVEHNICKKCYQRLNRKSHRGKYW